MAGCNHLSSLLVTKELKRISWFSVDYWSRAFRKMRGTKNHHLAANRVYLHI